MSYRQKRMAWWARTLASGSAFALGELVGNLEGIDWQSALFALVVCFVGAIALDFGSRR